MDNLRIYLLSIIVIAIICSVIVTITNDIGAVSSIIKLLCSIFITVAILTPLVTFSNVDMSNIFQMEIDTETIISEGEEVAENEKSRIIKMQTEAYISNKAESMGADIDVIVQLSEQEPMVPISVSITGDVSPYIKSRLQQIISNDIGLCEEALQWG